MCAEGRVGQEGYSKGGKAEVVEGRGSVRRGRSSAPSVPEMLV